jgi:acyl-homoserine-lactone acylase
LKQIGQKAYALKSANLEEHRFVEQWSLMGKSRSLDEFRSVLDLQALPMFNICYADKEGNVFYLCNGRFPDRAVGEVGPTNKDEPVGNDGPLGEFGPYGYARPVGYDWLGVVPGDTSATEWNRMLPQSRLPHLVNPPGGYVQNCNSAPWYTSLQAPIDRRRFPFWFSRNINGFRQQKSLLMIDADESITLEEVQRYKCDPKWLGAEKFKEDLVKIATAEHAEHGSAELKEAADVLSEWDNRGARDSKGALLFATIMRKYWARGAPTAVDWNEDRPVSTPSGIGSAETGRECIVEAVREMKERYGALAVRWGDVHRLRRGTVDVPIAGVEEDVMGAFRNIDYRREKDGKFAAAGGDSYVLAVEFTSPPTAYSISAYSQSSDPSSPHHCDQSALFADEKFKRAWFTEEEIAQNLERSYHP